MKRLTNGRWQVRWRDQERKQRARNFRTKELAQAFARKVYSGTAEPEQAPEPIPTFAVFADRFLREHSALYRPGSLQDDEARIKQHLIPALGAQRLDTITKAHLAKLFAYLKAKPTRHGRVRDNVSVNNTVKVAKTMLQVAVCWGLLEENPFKGVRYLPTPEKETAFWTAEERDRFYQFCKQRDPAFADLVLTACLTGLRMGELRALRRYQLDFRSGLIVVDATWNKRTKKREPRTKNGKAQQVRMVERLADLLSESRS